MQLLGINGLNFTMKKACEQAVAVTEINISHIFAQLSK